MEYKMTVTTNENNEDVFRLFSDDDFSQDVVLTSSESATDLKKLFSTLLTSLINDGSTNVAYEDTPTYKNDMYKEVCQEYVKVLTLEISNAKTRLAEDGLFDEIPEEEQMAK